MKWILLMILITSSGEETKVREFDTETSCMESKIKLLEKDEMRAKRIVFSECFDKKRLNEIRLNK